MSIAASMGMVGLGAETRKMVLDTIRKYGRRKLSHERLIELDKENRYPEDIMKELYDPNQVAINLVMIPEQYGGLGGNSFDIYRISELLASFDLGIATRLATSRHGPHLRRRHGRAEGEMDQEDRGVGRAVATPPRARGGFGPPTKTKAERVMDGDRVAGYKMWRQDGSPMERVRRLSGPGARPRASPGSSWRRNEGAHLRQARGQARHPPQRHDPADLPGRPCSAENPSAASRARPAPGAGGLWYTRLMVAVLAGAG